MDAPSKMGDGLVAGVLAAPELAMNLRAPRFTLLTRCFGPDGVLRWEDEGSNLVTTGGLTDIIDKYFKGTTYTAGWYLGLKGTGTISAADTAASHSGWTEEQNYSAGTRPAITFGTTSAGSNTATVVTFSMNAPYTAAGAFVISNSTKGGTLGTLYSARDFGSTRTGGNGDSIQVTLTVSAS